MPRLPSHKKASFLSSCYKNGGVAAQTLGKLHGRECVKEELSGQIAAKSDSRCSLQEWVRREKCNSGDCEYRPVDSCGCRELDSTDKPAHKKSLRGRLKPRPEAHYSIATSQAQKENRYKAPHEGTPKTPSICL
jgi:hypothetical protein